MLFSWVRSACWRIPRRSSSSRGAESSCLTATCPPGAGLSRAGSRYTPSVASEHYPFAQFTSSAYSGLLEQDTCFASPRIGRRLWTMTQIQQSDHADQMPDHRVSVGAVLLGQSGD